MNANLDAFSAAVTGGIAQQLNTLTRAFGLALTVLTALRVLSVLSVLSVLKALSVVVWMQYSSTVLAAVQETAYHYYSNEGGVSDISLTYVGM